MKKHLNILDTLSADKQDLILAHLSKIIEINKVTNLTRITDLAEAQVFHIEDSLVGLEELERAPVGRYADLGSGGGYPGIPLAIASGRQTILVESVKKKARSLRKILAEIGLTSQITVFDGRIEELALQERNEFAVVTARALSSLPSLLELASPLLCKGGQLLCYKSQSVEDELTKAKKVQNKLGMSLVSERIVDLEKHERRILVFEKIMDAEVTLPRRSGMAQKRPYS